MIYIPVLVHKMIHILLRVFQMLNRVNHLTYYSCSVIAIVVMQKTWISNYIFISIFDVDFVLSSRENFCTLASPSEQ